MNRTVYKRTACNRDCPDACGVIATIENGQIQRLQGDVTHPVTQGFMCHRTSRFLERQYAADRLTTPLLRDGDTFRPVSWTEALDQIAAQMRRFHAESGPASVLHYRCGGSMGLLKHVVDHFFERFGPVTIKSGDVCSGAGEAAQVADFGCCDSHDLFDLEHSRTIVLWGKNVYVSSVHLLPILQRARDRGTRLVLIDPVHHRTAQLCDTVLQPRAGGDAALALGVARWLFDHGRNDPAAVEYCEHFEAFRSLVGSRTVSEWAAAADVLVEQLWQLAEVYAQGPSAILVGWGLQRRKFGATNVRCLDALAAISGNLGVRGGGVSFYFRRRGAFDLSFARPELAPRAIPEPLLGPGIFAQRDPPIRMVWVTAANPVAMLPESRTVAEALTSRELTVVVDQFLTDTARCAHLVLPTTTFLEEEDLLGAYGHHWLTAMRPVVDAPRGVKSDYQIVHELATRLGLADEFPADAAVWRTRLLSQLSAHGITLEQLENGAVRNPFAAEVLFADRRFPTASGRVHLIHDLPDAAVTPDPSGTLRLAALSTAAAQSSQWPAATQQGPAVATVHPSAARGFHDGQVVQLKSAIGSLEVTLRLDPRQRPDLVLMDKGGWLQAGRCANVLVPAELTDDGQCAVYYDTQVELTARESS